MYNNHVTCKKTGKGDGCYWPGAESTRRLHLATNGHTPAIGDSHTALSTWCAK